MKYYLFPFVFLIMIGCSAEATEDDLIGGYWIGTAGYKDGEPEGDSYCTPFAEGLMFKDEDTVYVEDYDRELEYWLEDNNDGIEIHFRGESAGTYLRYYIDKIDEDEIGLKGIGDLQKKESCYLERQ